MKLMRLLWLIAVCSFHCGYAMQNREEQIVENLKEARALLIAAEYRIDGMSELTKYSPYIKYMESQLKEALEWTDEAHNLSQKVVHDNLASAEAKKEAQLCLDRASKIRQERTIKL
jgi:hypothetical protein